MARLRAADLRVGDRLRYTIGKGLTAVHIAGRIDGIERGDGTPTMVLFTRSDSGGQMLLRAGDVARHSVRLRDTFEVAS